MRIQESPTIRSYRELLNVGPAASEAELTKAYRRMAFLYHPDRNSEPEAQEQFLKVQKAYQVLSDPLRVKIMNRDHAQERLYRPCVEGLNISFGSFFGYRRFSAGAARQNRALRLGSESTNNKEEGWSDLFEVFENQSILDHAAYDSIELVFAGKHSQDDEILLRESTPNKGFKSLPWILLNNQGILYFLQGRYHQALRCYEQLNHRVPGNILFLYRLSLCHVVIAFERSQRGFLGKVRPDLRHLKVGIGGLRQCIHWGESRPVGKQKCLVIRKILAEVLEKSGQRRAALQSWRKIYDLDPHSVEATYKTKGLRQAKDLFQKKYPALSQKTAASSAKMLRSSRT